ncbi:MAG: methyltransferase domain-containing protein [Oscillatoriophycideae cyanobacterium NC_groundwater_1537_Pr4_S-0.65um_50_18]|nr:methyltransferase domain-containing protein [Oscillatoriophycideae cyanobacterium NC_groundwater_1537_Pr4_S-0.65um_50_18]
MKTISKLHSHDHAPATEGRTIRWAHLYDALVGVMTLGKGQAIRETTAAMAKIKTGDKVLDVGCGTGDLTFAAKAHAGVTGEVHGTDASPEMIEMAKRKASQSGTQINFQVDLIEKMSFPDNYFDVVLSSLMMHHLPNTIKRQGLAEIRRVLKPGGRLVIVDFRRPNTFTEHILTALLLHGGMQNGVQDLPTLMKEVGFSNIETGDVKFMMLGFARAESA